MEAKGTIIQLCNHPYHNRECHKDQAEYSFKLGEQEGWEKREKLAIQSIIEARLNGIREVVEWMMENYPEVCDYHLSTKLKEWGIEEGK